MSNTTSLAHEILNNTMSVDEEDPLKDTDSLQSKESEEGREGNSNPVIDDGLFSLLHDDFVQGQESTGNVTDDAEENSGRYSLTMGGVQIFTRLCLDLDFT